MKHDGDILSKFKLLTDSTMSDTSSRRQQNQRTLDIFDGFLQDNDDNRQDIFGSFLRRSSDVKPKNYKLPDNIAEFVEADIDKAEYIEKEQKAKSKKQNFIQKAIKSFLNDQSSEKTQKASEPVSLQKEKEIKAKKTSFERFADNIDLTEVFLFDVPGFDDFEFSDFRSDKKSLNTSLISTVAKISVDYNTDKMEDIIKSDRLSDTELFELFVNYVKISLDESSESSDVLNEAILKVQANNGPVSLDSKLDRAKLEEVFISFINETSKSGSLEGTNVAVSQLVVEFAAAINTDYMTRDELEELFVRFSRTLSFKHPDAFKELSSILSNSLSVAFTPDDGSAMRNADVVNNFRSAISPESMTRDQLEEIFIRFVREVSINASDAWSDMQTILSNAVSNAYAPDVSMDDSSRAAIAGFSLAISPENMTRDELEELFIRFSREVSGKFPAAWAELQGIFANALPNIYIPDLTMDDSSRSAIIGFSQMIKPEVMTRETLEELFVRFAREISISFPAAWSEIQGMLSLALSNAYIPDVSMDESSRMAIAGFSQAIKPEFMTRDTLEELFVRFSREISIAFPAAWSELQAILSLALSDAFAPDTSMDDSSRSAIAGFSQSIKPEFMTRDELEELFVRFSREVSVSFPVAWNQLQGMLSLAVANAFAPDTSMDTSSRAAISGFSQAIKPEYMTRDELEELFVRFSREVSTRFPAAWAELQGTLNTSLPNALVLDTSMDDSSRAAIAGFSLEIKPDIMTREQLETSFLRFTREISVKFPAAWAELQAVLNNALPHAFVPDTSMDSATKSLVDEFESTITTGTFTEDQLESIFADYMRQVPLMFPVVKSIIETTASNKRGDAELLDKKLVGEDHEYEAINKDFMQLSKISNDLNLKAQDISKDLRSAINKDDIKVNVDKLQKIESEKSSLDSTYSISKLDMDSNIKATNNISDDYTQKLDLSYEKKDDRSLFELDTNELSNWDMLRMLRRNEVLDVMYDMPKDELADCLHSVPKYLLKQSLTQLPVEDMCRVLFNARFPEALLREMPRNKAIELLPSADQMLPILMNMGQIGGFRNGCDLLEEVIVKGMGVEPEQNPTRTEDEILPFVMEQLIGKTPRNADAVRPVLGKKSSIDRAMVNVESDSGVQYRHLDKDKQIDQKLNLGQNERDINLSENRQEDLESVSVDKDQKLLDKQSKTETTEVKDEKLELKYRSPESLKEKQLESMAQDTIKNMGDKESQQVLAAKRGDPVQILEFLESMKKVKDLAGAKMAVSVLSNHQQKALAKAALPLLETKHIVKISQNYGMSSTEMVKQMPRYSVEGLIKSLPKQNMIEGFKLLDKSLMIGMLKTQSSQTIARVASESLSRNVVKDVAFKKMGFV